MLRILAIGALFTGFAVVPTAAQDEGAQDTSAHTTMADDNAGMSAPQAASMVNRRSSNGVKEFNLIDKDGDGVVTQQEYVDFATAPSNISASEARRLFNIASRGDGQLTHTEFVTPSAELNRVADEILSPKTND